MLFNLSHTIMGVQSTLLVSEAMNSAKLSLFLFLACLAIVIYPRLRRRLVLGKHSSTQFRAQERGVRLIQVDTPNKDEKETDIDIIAIHGLETSSPKTWEWEAGDLKKVNWLSHPEMLPKTAERARIFCCDWLADLYERPNLIQKTVDELAHLLLAGIKGQLLEMDGHARDNRPILFIASCLGGIILMKALVIAGHGNEYTFLRQATRGIIFLATPFRGTSFQDVANWAEPTLKVWALLQGQKVSQLLSEVKPTFNLEELVRHFTILSLEEKYILGNFYETGKTSLLRKVFPWLPISIAQGKPVRIWQQQLFPSLPSSHFQ